jgi:hypothetical protein
MTPCSLVSFGNFQFYAADQSSFSSSKVGKHLTGSRSHNRQNQHINHLNQVYLIPAHQEMLLYAAKGMTYFYIKSHVFVGEKVSENAHSLKILIE